MSDKSLQNTIALSHSNSVCECPPCVSTATGLSYVWVSHAQSGLILTQLKESLVSPGPPKATLWNVSSWHQTHLFGQNTYTQSSFWQRLPFLEIPVLIIGTVLFMRSFWYVLLLEIGERFTHELKKNRTADAQSLKSPQEISKHGGLFAFNYKYPH